MKEVQKELPQSPGVIPPSRILLPHLELFQFLNQFNKLIANDYIGMQSLPMQKKVMNLKENKEGYKEEVGARRGKGEKMYLYYNLQLQN